MVVVLFFPAIGFSQGPGVNWIKGPGVVELGDDIARLDLSSDYIFADAADTRKLMQSIGNPVTKLEAGLVAPRNSTREWFMVFEYNPIGYIKDAENEEIDADDLLKTIQKATELANQERTQKGFPILKVIGWHMRPEYDVETNNLVWALEADENGRRIVNYNTRLLGRHGYMSAVLVTDVETFGYLSYDVSEILNGFSFKKGKTYAEYVKGDKLAKLGLAALIVGGTAAAAAKFGLLKYLAKGGKFVLMALFGILSAIWGALKAVFRVKTKASTDASGSAVPLPEEPASVSDSVSQASLFERVERLMEQKRTEDAFVLIKAETRGIQITDLKLAKIYHSLLTEHRHIPDLLKHAKVYIDLLIDNTQKASAFNVYLGCIDHDARFAPNPDSYFVIAQFLARKKSAKSAMNACLHLAKTYPDHAVLPEVYFFMAKLLNEHLNNKIKAKKIITWLTQKYPKHKSTTMAQRYLVVIGN